MSAVFLKLLNMSITASYFALGVMILRLILKRTPKWITVLLWGLVGLRLLLPFSIESKQSLIPTTDTIPPQILYDPQPTIQSGIPVVNDFVNPIVTESLTPQAGASVNPVQIYIAVAAYIWISGMGLMAAYCLFSYFRLRRSLREAIPLRENIWLCDRLPSPFLLGLFRPRIYIPSDLKEEDLPYVLAHEEAHIKRKDHWWKPLGYLLLTVYWFNLLLWLAYILLCRDIEGACDEKVLRDLGQEGKKAYSRSLLRCSIPKRRLSACPVAFGEGNVKGRISSILSYKKPTLWILILALVATAVLSLWFLTDPVPSYEVWFDFMQPVEDYGEQYYKMQFPQEVPDYPDLFVKISNNRLVVVQDGKTHSPFPNRYMFNGFFADINQDGSPELCCSGFTYVEGYLGSDPSAYVYDFATGESHYASLDLPFGAYHFALVDGALTLCSSDFNSNRISFDFNSQLQSNLKLLREAAIMSYGEPLLVRDARSDNTVFAWRVQEALYPFYLSWERKRLSEMDDEELTVFLSGSIPDTDRISAPQLEAARSVIHKVEQDPTIPLHFAVEESSWELKVNRAAAEYYGHPFASILPFRDGALTLAHVIELSHKGYALTWEDLFPFKGTDIGSGLYIMEYPINDRYTLMCRDGKLTGSPMTAFLIDSQTGLSIDIRRDLVEGFLLTPTHEKWFDSPDYAGILTATHPTIPDLRFTFDRGKATISIETEGKHRDIILNDGIRNAYFADVTLDGVADLCCSYILGYGISTAGILYYDPVNMTSHHISDTMGYQYALAERDGLLQIRISTASDPHKKEYYDLRSIATGNLPDPMNIGELIEKFPQYFNLDAQHGLVLYVSEYKSEAYACRLISHPGTSTLPEIDLTQLVPCSSSQMIRILSTYRNMEAPLHIVAVETTYSTQSYATPEEYAQALQDIFTLITQSLSPIITHPGN